MKKETKIIIIVIISVILFAIIGTILVNVIGNNKDFNTKIDCLNSGGYIDKNGKCILSSNDSTNDPDNNENEENTEDVNNCLFTETFVGDEDINFLSKDAQYLYNKYIKYYHKVNNKHDQKVNIIETGNYKNININDSSSDAYLIKFAIFNILQDNNIDIDDYDCVDECLNAQDYKNGYKITNSQIMAYVKNNFKINRDIDFKNAELNFTCNSGITFHYFDNEGYYKLVDAFSIPASHCSGDTVFSKVVKEENIGKDLIIYTQYMNFGLDGDVKWVEDSVDSESMAELDHYEENCEQITNNCYGIYYDEFLKTCILSNYSDRVGQFKHTFTKDSEGNYYWVSTQKIN